MLLLLLVNNNLYLIFKKVKNRKIINIKRFKISYLDIIK